MILYTKIYAEIYFEFLWLCLGHTNRDMVFFRLNGITKSYFGNPANLERPVWRFVREPVTSVIQYLDVPNLWDCKTPGLSMEQVADVYQDLANR